MKTIQMLNSYIKAHAYLLSKFRRIDNYGNQVIEKVISTKEEEIYDWNNAVAIVALQIIEGGIPLNQIDTDSYGILENTWEKNIKQLKAFFLWRDKGDMDDNYFEASNKIRDLLFNAQTYPLRDFEKISKYIETRYLNDEGIIDESKEATHQLIARKAEHIYQNTLNQNDRENWFRAKLYVRFFYENIIPAIVYNDSECINNVLKAFEFSKSSENCFHITNCFEAAIAIYFINKRKLQLIINNPELYSFNMVPTRYWPSNFSTLSKKFRYDSKVNLITYEGAMSLKDKNTLLIDINQEQYQQKIEELYLQSNLQPYESMIL